MLRLGAAILSPLRTRLDERSPDTPVYSSLEGTHWQGELPEQYARDAIIQVMRRATEAFKEAETEADRLQVRACCDVPSRDAKLSLVSCSYYKMFSAS